MAFDWGPVIAAGVNLAQGLLQDSARDDATALSNEQFLMNLQAQERDRAAAMDRAQLAANASIQAANISADVAKKRILGDVLLQQGQGQEKLMLESFRASANAPERFNTAANILAQILSK